MPDPVGECEQPQPEPDDTLICSESCEEDIGRAEIEDVVKNGRIISEGQDTGIVNYFDQHSTEREEAGPAKVGIQQRVRGTGAHNIFCIARVAVDDVETRFLLDEHRDAIEHDDDEDKVQEQDGCTYVCTL